jgi:hypothetical protein
MPIKLYLEQRRGEYLRALAEFVQRFRSEHKHVTTELLILPNGASNPPPYSLIRIDVATGAANDFAPYRFVVDVRQTGATVEYQYGTMLVRLEPFSWESVQLTFSCRRFSLESLRPWLARWLDDAEHQRDEHGFEGVIHTIGWSSLTDELWELVFDFGSAPVSAVMELLAILRDSGVTEVYFEPSANFA